MVTLTLGNVLFLWVAHLQGQVLLWAELRPNAERMPWEEPEPGSLSWDQVLTFVLQMLFLQGASCSVWVMDAMGIQKGGYKAQVPSWLCGR